jgi:hypothetical protein
MLSSNVTRRVQPGAALHENSDSAVLADARRDRHVVAAPHRARLVFGISQGRRIDLRIDFDRKLSGIREVYDLDHSAR